MECISAVKFYMDVQLDFGEEFGNQGLEIDHNQFKWAITLAMKQLFGDMGRIIPVDVLKYEEGVRRAFIRFPANELVKVWSSLTMFSKYNNNDCMFRIFKVTPALSCLSLSSQVFEHKEVENCQSSAEKQLI